MCFSQATVKTATRKSHLLQTKIQHFDKDANSNDAIQEERGGRKKKKQPLPHDVLFAFPYIGVALLCNGNAASETSDKKTEERKEKKEKKRRMEKKGSR